MKLFNKIGLSLSALLLSLGVFSGVSYFNSKSFLVDNVLNNSLNKSKLILNSEDIKKSLFKSVNNKLDNLVNSVEKKFDVVYDDFIYHFDNSNFGKYVNYLNNPLVRDIETFDSKYTSFVGREIKADIDFFPYLFKLDSYAKSCGVKLYVNSSFRKLNSKIKRKVFEPAKFSNHHVGRAVDLNVVYNNYIYSSKLVFDNFKSLPSNVKCFYNSILKDMRYDFKVDRTYDKSIVWGGVFGDVVHFDDNYSKKNRAEFNKLFRLYQFNSLNDVVMNFE